MYDFQFNCRDVAFVATSATVTMSASDPCVAVIITKFETDTGYKHPGDLVFTRPSVNTMMLRSFQLCQR